MIKEAIGTGSTIEQAKENALLLLNAAPDQDIEIEVLATPKKKTLGLFGGSDAKVRVYYEVPDAPAKAPAKKPRPKRDEGAQAANKGKEKKAPSAKPHAAKAPSDSQPAPQAKAEQDEAPQETLAFVDAATLDAASPAGRAVAYLEKVLSHLECKNVSFRVAAIENGAVIAIEGDDLGVVIGRRGETLDALQYLASLASNAGASGYFRITLNIGDFRQRREQTLRSLARRTSNQVLRTGRSRSLEPMNPYERRIIHTVVQGIDGVTSNSIGDGPARRVVISLNGAGSERESNRRRGGRPNGDRRPAGDRRTVGSKGADTNLRPPKQDATELPLYGRIDKS